MKFYQEKLEEVHESPARRFGDPDHGREPVSLVLQFLVIRITFHVVECEQVELEQTLYA